MDIEFKIEGAQEIEASLERLISRLPDEVGKALYAEAQTEREESMRRTPVDTGALRASHTVTQPKVSGRDIEVTIGVGGPAAPYAVHVHENLEAFHAVGQAKFLQSTLFESIPFLAKRIAARLRLRGRT